MTKFEVEPFSIIQPQALSGLNGEVDALAAITYSANADHLNESGDPVLRLSSISRASIDATVALATRLDRPVRIAGEHSFGLENHSTAELMVEHASSSGLPIEDLETPKTNLIHTAKQMEAHARRAEGTTGTLVVIGMGFHLERVIEHSKAFSLKVIGVSVQDVIDNEGLGHRYPELAHVGPIAERESTIRQLSRFDGKGRILDVISFIQGPRLHDVVEDGDSYRTIMTTTRKRIRELREST